MNEITTAIGISPEDVRIIQWQRKLLFFSSISQARDGTPGNGDAGAAFSIRPPPSTLAIAKREKWFFFFLTFGRRESRSSTHSKHTSCWKWIVFKCRYWLMSTGKNWEFAIAVPIRSRCAKNVKKSKIFFEMSPKLCLLFWLLEMITLFWKMPLFFCLNKLMVDLAIQI